MRSLAACGDFVVALDEELELGTTSMGCAENTSGDEDDGVRPRDLLSCSSSCFMPGNGKSLGSLYLGSADVAGGTGDVPPGCAACGASDRMEPDAEGDCTSGGLCCGGPTLVRSPPLSAFALVWLIPLSLLTLESVLYRRSRAPMLFVRERRPLLELLLVKLFFSRSQVV